MTRAQIKGDNWEGIGSGKMKMCIGESTLIIIIFFEKSK